AEVSTPEQKIAIAATFTAEPVEESLRYWMKELELPVEIEFAPFNQVFQQLLDPMSVLAKNPRGANVILLRVADLGGDAGAAAEIERGAREFLSAIKGASTRLTTPMLVILCPGKPQQVRAFEAVERMILAELEKLNGVYVVTTEEMSELYPVEEYY